jgi:hypothetical protein
VNAAIVSTHLDTAIRRTDRSNKIDIWQEAIDTNEVLVLVLMLQVLAGDFDLVELAISELAQMRGEVFE